MFLTSCQLAYPSIWLEQVVRKRNFPPKPMLFAISLAGVSSSSPRNLSGSRSLPLALLQKDSWFRWDDSIQRRPCPHAMGKYDPGSFVYTVSTFLSNRLITSWQSIETPGLPPHPLPSHFFSNLLKSKFGIHRFIDNKISTIIKWFPAIFMAPYSKTNFLATFQTYFHL